MKSLTTNSRFNRVFFFFLGGGGECSLNMRFRLVSWGQIGLKIWLCITFFWTYYSPAFDCRRRGLISV